MYIYIGNVLKGYFTSR